MCPHKSPELIPREILFGNPTKTNPTISANGKKIAYLAPVNNVLNIWVKTVGLADDLAVTKDTNRGIHRYFWAEDNKYILYLQDVGGDENWRLYGVNLETTKIKDYTPYKNVQVRILEHNKHYPNELLILMNKENPQIHDVYHLDLTTAKLKLVAKNPGNVIMWVADTNLRVRAALTSTPEGGFDLMVRENTQSQLRKIITWDSEDALSSGPISFTKDGSSIYLLDSRGTNTTQLAKIQIATGQIKAIFQDPKYDIGEIMIHPDKYTIQAISITKERQDWVVLDESIKDDFAKIRKIDKGDFFISSRDNADQNWTVGFLKDAGPVSFYIYNRQLKEATFLFDHKPDLNDYRLAPMEAISFTSRDGFKICGYITYPLAKAKKNLPVVLYVHGGPWVRDTWGYDATAQWFANRGYAVLQVNYRGSTGYGKNFLNAGNKEWGGAMHNDLVDAVNSLINKGIADPKKIAIFGGSYGGYAALVGATFTPDLFCCAVDIVGPSNLITFIKSIPPYWKTFLDVLRKRVGDPDTEGDFLKSRSPLFKVEAIKIPLLIAQGANDPRVKQAESEQIVEALKSKGIEHQYIVFSDEGHGFAKPENRLKFYAIAEKFLGRHLGGRYED